MVKATLEFNIDVAAESLAEAVEVANKMTISDIEAGLPPGYGYNDHNIIVQGVFVNE